MRILVIDDEETVRNLICCMLVEFGFDATAAENGYEGMKLLESAEDIDIVVTDLVMPDMEGMETIREIRKLPRQPKILAISGGGRGSGDTYLTLARMIGADATLAKPFTEEALIGSVRELAESVPR